MRIALLGATGAVGQTMLDVLSHSRLEVDDLLLLASPRSEGKTIQWEQNEYTVRTPERGVFRGVDLALFSAGAERSREWAPVAAEEGAIVVDNSSAWRLDPEVPLVVPEVNADAISRRPKGIIANPNCSTIQVVLPLKALHDAAGLRRVVMTTYQSVSGSGEKGRAALKSELAGQVAKQSPFSRRIAGNVIPQIGDFDEDGWTSEERKMTDEPRKILGLPDLPIVATCVRVPVDLGHSVQIMAELDSDLDLQAAHEAMRSVDGVTVAERPEDFPTAVDAAGRNDVLVGRMRTDPHVPRIIHLWVVADNLRKGAASNAVQIAEHIQHA